jgi:hypothetical protein
MARNIRDEQLKRMQAFFTEEPLEVAQAVLGMMGILVKSRASEAEPMEVTPAKRVKRRKKLQVPMVEGEVS